MSDECAFFSNHPAVMAWNEALQAEHVAYNERLNLFKADYPGRNLVVIKNRRRHDAVGLDGGEAPEPAKLWRQRHWFWVPSKSTKAGKELAAHVAGLGMSIPPIPGMTSEVWCADPRGNGSMIIKSPGTLIVPGGMWVHWDVSADEVRSPDHMRGDVVDESMWTLRKLSEFHAAKEAQEES